MFVLAVGNVHKGFEFFGMFKEPENAIRYATDHHFPEYEVIPVKIAN